MPIPLCELLSSLESLIVTSDPISSSCFVTFSTSSPIVSDQLFVSPNVPFAGKLSRKRRKEDSCATLISKEEMWVQFQKCWSAVSSSSSWPFHSPKDFSGLSSSSSSCSAHHLLPVLKTDMASDHDGNPPRFLKEFADELASVL